MVARVTTGEYQSFVGRPVVAKLPGFLILLQVQENIISESSDMA